MEQAKLIQDIIISVRHLGIYPDKHPIVVNSCRTICNQLTGLLKGKEQLSLNVSPDNKICLNGEPVLDKSAGELDAFIPLFRRLNVEDLVFTPGITESEVSAFVRLFTLGPQELKQYEDINQLFNAKGISHLRAKQFSYIKVEKGKEDQVNIGQQRLDRLKSQLSGSQKQPMADAQSLEKDLVAAVGDELKEKKKLGVSLRSLFKKFVQRSPEEEQALVRLKDALAAYGCPLEDVDRLIAAIKEELIRGPQVRTRGQTVPPEEFRRLQEEHVQLQQAYTRLEQQNRRISDEKQRIDNIVHNMAEGMVVVDAEGKIILVNSAAEQLLGITKADVGRKLREVVKNEHLLTLTKQIAADAEGVMQKDIELVSADESTKRVLRTSSAVVEDPNGATVGMVTMLNDITRQREVERLKEGFLASVSHELRTPLIAVEKSLSLVLRESAETMKPEHREFLGIAERNLKRLTLLINDLLDLSKLEAGKMQLQRQPADLAPVITEAVQSLGNWAAAKSLRFSLDLAEGMPQAQIDPNRIIQVLTNILGNAVKFSPAGGVIAVQAHYLADQRLIEVRINDNGPGIPEKDLARIFDKFYQTSQRPSSDINGTGIGLAVVRELVQLHGGSVRAENVPGGGAAFVFTLPVNGR